MKKKLTLMTLVLLWVSQMMAVDYTINVQSAGCDAVAYTLPSGAVGQIQAVANTGYHFTQWSDGNTDNPRTITVTGNKTYTATFAAITYTITAKSNNTSYGTVSGGGKYNVNTTATLTATPKSGYKFVQWNDGSTQNPRTVTVTGDKTYTATFEGVPYTITAKSANNLMGTVSGSGTYNVNTTVTLTATPKSGYKFVQWNDGNKENPRQIVVLSDMTYTAIFEEDVDGIREITAAGINIYTEGKNIVVENATESVTVSDALGRVVGKDDAHIVPTETHKFPVPSSGVYVVKIGNRAASVLVR